MTQPPHVRLKLNRTVFRALVALTVVTTVASSVISFAGVRYLPTALADYVRGGSGAVLSRTALAVVGYGGSLLVVVAVVGLLFFWKPARALLLAALALDVLVSPFLGITVQLPLATTLDGISGVLTGMVVALAYFSPVANFFERSPMRATAERDQT
jgi:hypothetical protein